MITEELFQFIWKYRLYNSAQLRTTEGEEVHVLSAGLHNTNAGPDFLNAKVRIGDKTWSGHVELHIKASDWKRHGHKNDKAYENVILHIVFNDDDCAKGDTLNNFPKVELKDRIDANLISRYENLLKSKARIPCSNLIQSVDSLTISNMQERLVIERLEQKVEHVHSLLNQTANNWEQVTFILLSRYFGSSVNKDSFEELASLLPINLLSKYSGDTFQCESLLFGQAGFLQEDFTDDYPRRLKAEFNYLKKLHSLQPINNSRFKFLRLRPSNFPTLRIAQLGGIISKNPKLFASLLELKGVKDVYSLLNVAPSPYWKDHYRFDTLSHKVKWKLGKSKMDTISINVIAPLLFTYGKYKDEQVWCDKAIQFLCSIPAEKNSIISAWNALAIESENAAQTQAMIQLQTNYCDKMKCLDCAIGLSVLGK